MSDSSCIYSCSMHMHMVLFGITIYIIASPASGSWEHGKLYCRVYLFITTLLSNGLDSCSCMHAYILGLYRLYIVHGVSISAMPLKCIIQLIYFSG